MGFFVDTSCSLPGYLVSLPTSSESNVGTGLPLGSQIRLVSSSVRAPSPIFKMSGGKAWR